MGLVFSMAALCAASQDATVGARAKAMGGGYSAFEDDPLSVWCNPAGMAAQSGGAALEYQTYTTYGKSGPGTPPAHFPGSVGFNEPGGMPSYLGAVYQIGTVERPQALGLCFVSPMLLKLAFDAPDDDVGGPLFTPNVWSTEQSYSRIRLAYARDFRFRAVGEEGWFPHLAIGLGMDAAMSTLRMTDLFTGESHRASRSEFGGGFGVLVGVFDNTRTVKLNLGATFQSAVGVDIPLPVTMEPRRGPALNWPDQFSLGVLLYLLEGLPLRISAEVQSVDWRGASQQSDLPGVGGFSKTTAYSMGAEYRIPLTSSMTLFPRMGWRVQDAPWNSADKSKLPAFEEWQLAINPRAARFLTFSVGCGVSFTSDNGRVSSLEFSFETGADAPAAALGVIVGF